MSKLYKEISVHEVTAKKLRGPDVISKRDREFLNSLDIIYLDTKSRISVRLVKIKNYNIPTNVWTLYKYTDDYWSLSAYQVGGYKYYLMDSNDGLKQFIDEF